LPPDRAFSFFFLSEFAFIISLSTFFSPIHTLLHC
jgi:hypothetical protein